jgi:stearoyl-CoA desaturase (delta-9 desaturase)
MSAPVRTDANRAPIAPVSIAHWIFFPAIHLLAAGAFLMPSWRNFACFLVMYFLTACLGITFCYHRLLAHRAYRASRWLLKATIPLAVLNVMGGPTDFIGTHRMHHLFSDTPDDPHNAGYGFWHSHWGWLFFRRPGRDWQRLVSYAPDIQADPYLRFFDSVTVQLLLNVVMGVLLFLLGGWGFVFWGMFLRIVWVYHLTFLTNSASHLWGYRTYECKDGSRNNVWVGALSMGEGWQNNHHAYPTLAKLGHRWWELDVTYLVIRAFSAAGWVTGVKTEPGPHPS